MFRIYQKHKDSCNSCDDFYNYACGSYNSYTKLPNNDTFKWDEMDIMRLKVEQELFLTVNTTFGDESEVMKIPKKLYKACMDFGDFSKCQKIANIHFRNYFTDVIKSRGVKPLKDLIDDIGGWPVVDDDSNSSWVDLREKSMKLGLNIEFPFSFFVIPDYMKNSSRRMIAVS